MWSSPNLFIVIFFILRVICILLWIREGRLQENLLWLPVDLYLLYGYIRNIKKLRKEDAEKEKRKATENLKEKESKKDEAEKS